MKNELSLYINKIQKKYSGIINECEKRDFLDTLRMLSEWGETEKYPKVNMKIKFPKTIYIAYAVCSIKCGAKEFIVDGGTQQCQYDGRQMFRGPVKKYNLDEKSVK